MRDAEAAEAIRHTERVLVSWAPLLVAPFAALVGSVADVAGTS